MIVTQNQQNEIVQMNQEEINQIEKELDSQVKEYIGFTKERPMNYVSYDSRNKTYKFRINGKTHINKDVTQICEISRQTIQDKYLEKKQEIGLITGIIPFLYKNKKIIIYNNVNDPLFDIRHIINLLNLKYDQSNEKYNEFKQYITHFGFKKNEFGGYIFKEFISFKGMVSIVMSSNSEFSKTFKDDVTEILDKLRKNGNLAIDNEKIDVIPKQPKKKLIKDIAGCDIDAVSMVLNASSGGISCIYMFTIGQVEELRESMKKENVYDDENYEKKIENKED